MMCVGFTIGYGAMFVKTWRVYRIFTNTRMTKEVTSNDFSNFLFQYPCIKKLAPFKLGQFESLTSEEFAQNVDRLLSISYLEYSSL